MNTRCAVWAVLVLVALPIVLAQTPPDVVAVFDSANPPTIEQFTGLPPAEQTADRLMKLYTGTTPKDAIDKMMIENPQEAIKYLLSDKVPFSDGDKGAVEAARRILEEPMDQEGQLQQRIELLQKYLRYSNGLKSIVGEGTVVINGDKLVIDDKSVSLDALKDVDITMEKGSFQISQGTEPVVVETPVGSFLFDGAEGGGTSLLISTEGEKTVVMLSNPGLTAEGMERIGSLTFTRGGEKPTFATEKYFADSEAIFSSTGRNMQIVFDKEGQVLDIVGRGWDAKGHMFGINAITTVTSQSGKISAVYDAEGATIAGTNVVARLAVSSGMVRIDGTFDECRISGQGRGVDSVNLRSATLRDDSLSEVSTHCAAGECPTTVVFDLHGKDFKEVLTQTRAAHPGNALVALNVEQDNSPDDATLLAGKTYLFVGRTEALGRTASTIEATADEAFISISDKRRADVFVDVQGKPQDGPVASIWQNGVRIDVNAGGGSLGSSITPENLQFAQLNKFPVAQAVAVAQPKTDWNPQGNPLIIYTAATADPSSWTGQQYEGYKPSWVTAVPASAQTYFIGPQGSSIGLAGPMEVPASYFAALEDNLRGQWSSTLPWAIKGTVETGINDVTLGYVNQLAGLPKELNPPMMEEKYRKVEIADPQFPSWTGIKSPPPAPIENPQEPEEVLKYIWQELQKKSNEPKTNKPAEGSVPEERPPAGQPLQPSLNAEQQITGYYDPLEQYKTYAARVAAMG